MIAGKYLESKNGEYQLDFQNSGLHLSCGSTAIWKYGFSNNEALYINSEGSALVLLNVALASHRIVLGKQLFSVIVFDTFYKSVAIWDASTGGYANKLVLQDDGNLVLRNDYNKTIWETKTAGVCPTGLEQFILIQM